MAQPKGPNRLIPPSELPLRTSGSHILGASGRIIRLFCVNWYGLHLPSMVFTGLDQQPVDKISATIADLGFNCVRLPYSLDTVYLNRTIPNASSALAANEDLVSKTPLEQLDEVLASLTNLGIAVILNNHISSSAWCCGFEDEEGLWYTKKYPQEKWFESISMLSQRYQDNPYVIGFDLRNELRPSDKGTPTFGGPKADLNWAAAASKAAQLVYAENPGMLVIVAGLFYNMFLCDVPTSPLHVASPGLPLDRIVYTAHEYDMTSIPLQAKKLLFGPWLQFLILGHLLALLVYLPIGCAKASAANAGLTNNNTNNNNNNTIEGIDECPATTFAPLYSPHPPSLPLYSSSCASSSSSTRDSKNNDNNNNNSHPASAPPSQPLNPTDSHAASSSTSSTLTSNHPLSSSTSSSSLPLHNPPSTSSLRLSSSSIHPCSGPLATCCVLRSGGILPRTQTLSSTDSSISPRDFRQPLMSRSWGCGNHPSRPGSRRFCLCCSGPAFWCDLSLVLVAASTFIPILLLGGMFLPTCGIYGNPLLPGLLTVLFLGVASVLLWLRFAFGSWAHCRRCRKGCGGSSIGQGDRRPAYRHRGRMGGQCADQGLFTPLSPPGAELATIVETGESSASLPSIPHVLSGPIGGHPSRFGLAEQISDCESPAVRSAAIGACISPADSPQTPPQLQELHDARSKEVSVMNLPAPFDIAPITPPPTELPYAFPAEGVHLRNRRRRPCMREPGRCWRQAPLCQLIFSVSAFSALLWVGLPLESYDTFEADLDARWGFLMKANNVSSATEDTPDPSVAPVWLGEFGTVEDTVWWEHMLRYMKEREVSFAYWSINGDPRHPYMAVLNQDSKTVQRSWKLNDLQALMAALADD